MRNVYIHLNNGALVKDFVETVKNLKDHFEIHSDFTVLDARSILGIYSLDLSSPLVLLVENDSEENMELLKPYIINNV